MKAKWYRKQTGCVSDKRILRPMGCYRAPEWWCLMAGESGRRGENPGRDASANIMLAPPNQELKSCSLRLAGYADDFPIVLKYREDANRS